MKRVLKEEFMEDIYSCQNNCFRTHGNLLTVYDESDMSFVVMTTEYYEGLMAKLKTLEDQLKEAECPCEDDVFTQNVVCMDSDDVVFF